MDCLDGDIYWDHMLPSLSKEQRIKVYQNKNGVALDISGTGKSDPSSLKEAIKTAKKIL